MKITMRLYTKLSMTISILVLTLLSPLANAITVVNNSDGSGYAYGVLEHNSTSASITCARAEGVNTSTTSSYSSTWCTANNGSGKTAYCYNSSAEFAGKLRGLSDHGRLWFNWSASGECTAMQIVNSTNYLPAP